MNPILLNVIIDENRRLIVDVPDDFPVGPAQVAITPVEDTKHPVTPPKFERAS